MYDLEEGDIIFEASIKQKYPNMELTYKAPKGKLFVNLLLGTIDSGQQHTVNDAKIDELMNSHGWYRKDKL